MNTDNSQPEFRITITVLRFLGQTLLLAAVLVAPWWFGGVQARAQEWLYFAVLGATACSIFVILLARERIALPVVLVVLTAALLLAGLQLVPVTRSVRNWLSPAHAQLDRTLVDNLLATNHTWIEELGVTFNSARRPLSVYPHSTRNDAAVLLMAVCVVFGAAVLFRGRRAVFLLLAAVTANGASLAFFGMVQRLSWNGRLYWTVPLAHGGSPFGPFVNRNNAGGYLLVCLGAAVFMVMWCISRYFTDTAWADTEQWREHSWFYRAKHRLQFVLGNLNATILTIFSAAGLVIAGILATVSRGAAVGLVVAILVTFVVSVLARIRYRVVAWLVAIAFASGLLISWVGIGPQLRTRFAALLDQREIKAGRTEHWQVGLQAARDFRWLGSGIGTYRYIYPKYQHDAVPYWFYHAENQYLEALVEGGVIGIALLVAALLLVARDVGTLIRLDANAVWTPLAVCGVLAVAGQAFMATCDFGLYIPANIILFATLCGVLGGRAAQLRATTRTQRRRAWPTSRAWLVAFGIALFIGGWWGVRRVRAVAQAESALNAAASSGVYASFSEPLIKQHIQRLNEAVEQLPQDAELHRQLGKAWAQLYRADTLNVLQQKSALKRDDPRLQQLTSLLLFHERTHFYARTQLPQELAKLRTLPAVRDDLVPALRQLLLAWRACPLLPAVHCGIAQVCGAVTDPGADEALLTTTLELAPADPELLFITGVLHYNAARYRAAWRVWKLGLTHSMKHLPDVLQLIGPGLAAPEIVAAALPDSPELLIRLVQRPPDGVSTEFARETLLDRADELLKDVDSQDGEPDYQRATIAKLRGDVSRADASYAKAVQRAPMQLVWRYEYAAFLMAQGDLDEAAEQIGFCVRREPYNNKFKRMAKTINDRKTYHTETRRARRRRMKD